MLEGDWGDLNGKASLSRYSRNKMTLQSKEVKQDWTGPKNFLAAMTKVFFSERQTGH